MDGSEKEDHVYHTANEVEKASNSWKEENEEHRVQPTSTGAHSSLYTFSQFSPFFP
jgi:hypothetical protein